MNWNTQPYPADQPGRIQDLYYDHFFWKKKKTKEQKAASKEKRRAFFDKVGHGVKNAGGAEGILGTVTNVFSFLKGNNTNAGPSDYQMSMGPAPNATQAIPTAVWIVGGVAVLAIGGYLYTQHQKKQAALSTAATQ